MGKGVSFIGMNASSSDHLQLSFHKGNRGEHSYSTLHLRWQTSSPVKVTGMTWLGNKAQPPSCAVSTLAMPVVLFVHSAGILRGLCLQQMFMSWCSLLPFASWNTFFVNSVLFALS